MRELTTTINDPRNASFNFMGLLDSRKTTIAINKVRATLLHVSNDAAQPKEED